MLQSRTTQVDESAVEEVLCDSARGEVDLRDPIRVCVCVSKGLKKH